MTSVSYQSLNIHTSLVNICISGWYFGDIKCDLTQNTTNILYVPIKTWRKIHGHGYGSKSRTRIMEPYIPQLCLINYNSSIFSSRWINVVSERFKRQIYWQEIIKKCGHCFEKESPLMFNRKTRCAMYVWCKSLESN